jgi:hypothetical protein
MVLSRWYPREKPFGNPPPQQRVHRLYTPTIDGFERFLRQMVGLDIVGLDEDSREKGQGRANRNHVRRKEP